MRTASILAVGLAANLALAQPASTPASEPGTAPSPAGAPASHTGEQAHADAFTPLAHIEMRGTGSVPMVLIPGLMSEWTVFESMMTRNASKYTMYAVTLPGFGGSLPPPLPDATPPSKTLWLDNAERAILDLIESKKIVKPVLVGHSMGAHLALRLAAKHPDKFQAAVAIDGLPAFPLMPGVELSKEQRAAQIDGVFAQQMGTLTDEVWTNQVRQGTSNMVKSADRAKEIAEMSVRVPRPTSVRYMLELLASDVTKELKASSCKVLGIAALGDDSTRFGSIDLAKAAWKSQFDAVPAATVVYFDDTRHFVMDDAPTELDLAIEQFLAGKDVQGKIAPPPAKAEPTPDPVRAVPTAPKPDAPGKTEPESPR
jgi:pimeloyl-ACP methyl ester carboxylesterase